MADEHQRQLIRRAAVAQLSGRTIADGRVVASRLVPWRTNQLPAIAVYTLFGGGAERIDLDEATTSGVLKRMLPLVIEGAVRVEQDVDDVLDAFAKQIERAMHADETVGRTAERALLMSTEADFAETGDQSIAVIQLTFAVTYYSEAPAAEDQSFDSFRTADIRHDLAGQQPTADEGHDTVELEGA